MTAIELLFSVGASLTANAIDRKISKNINFSSRKKIEAKIDELVVAVMDPVSDFLESEGVSLASIEIMADQARPYILWLTENEEFSFSRGLDADLITKDLLALKIFSTSARFDDYPAAFETILRALVDLVTKTPPVFSAWEKSSFQTIFKQTEDIKSTLSQIYDAMKSAAASQRGGVSEFEKITNHRATTAALKTNIHGLRQTPVPQAELDNLFVFPEFMHNLGQEGSRSEHKTQKIEEYPDFLKSILELKSMVIRAPAGAGKTTLSNWLISRLLNNNPRFFPIVISLRSIIASDKLPSLKEAFASNASAVFSDMISPERVSTWADDGKIVSIFEGLDEVSEQNRNEILEWIGAMRIAHPNLLMIITSRPLSTSHLDNLITQGWNDIRMLPFDIERVVTYIRRFQEHGPVIQTGAKLRDPEELARAWGSDPTLGPLTGNPLLLSTLLVVHHMDGELPDDRSRLYDRYIDGMLGLWELNKALAAPTVPLTKEQKKKILELIAINMISSEIDAASEENVAAWVSDYIEEEKISSDVKGILDHLRERSGLLIGPGQYTFAHKSIGEFLVAQACNDGIQTDALGTRFDRCLLRDNCNKDRWTTVTFLWAGVASKQEVQNFISYLIDIGNLKLAGGLLIERRKFLDRKWLQATFWLWLEKWLSDVADKTPKYEAFMKGPAPVPSLNPTTERMDIVGLTSINGSDSDEADMVSLFVESELINPEGFSKKSFNFNPLLWMEFARHTGINQELFNRRPDEISANCAAFAMIKNSIFHNSSRRSGSYEAISRNSFLADKFDIASIEAIVFLEHYSDYKSIAKDSQFEMDGIIDYFGARNSELNAAGVYSLISGTDAKDFGSLLYDALSEPYEGAFYYRPPNEKPLSFAENCALMLDADVPDFEMNPWESHIRRIISEYESRIS